MTDFCSFMYSVGYRSIMLNVVPPTSMVVIQFANSAEKDKTLLFNRAYCSE